MMDREFNVVDEVRKHPGITAGVVAVLAGVGLATILLSQRTGPTRYERIKTRIDRAAGSTPRLCATALTTSRAACATARTT